MDIRNRSALQATLVKTLDWSYGAALAGLPGMASAEALAESYLKRPGSRWKQAGSLIRWQVTKAGTAGLAASFGGAITLPVAVTASMASVAYLQLRMTAALAHMGGFDVRDDRVRTLCYACLTGLAAADVMREFGVRLSAKLSRKAIEGISGETLRTINRRVGFRLVTKFGKTGLVNLGKLIPVAGGVVGGAVDATTTRMVGGVARWVFIGRDGGDDASAMAVEPVAPPGAPDAEGATTISSNVG